MGLKDLEDTTHPRRPQTPHLRKKGKEEEGDVVEIVTTTGDRDAVDPGHSTSESAQILIREIMVCNKDLENIPEKHK
ncbi:hypothetical protein AB205_0045670 [Aquarana catesbeiana]|uniref:Uncharacterized protein n=1 Tax=Aquarana catesbeiana TaxID=8400 RepID=A0A2G9QB06_AQUCT|nr:hypothetical protein AB205_0045670 [Aquarana catesbeiana]